MNRLILILILTFSFQTLARADDLRDLEIAGISVGDSLLDHFSKEKILEELNSSFTYIYKDNKFADMAIGNSDVYILNTTDEKPSAHKKCGSPARHCCFLRATIKRSDRLG